jgi:hypothetical protein
MGWAPRTWTATRATNIIPSHEMCAASLGKHALSHNKVKKPRQTKRLRAVFSKICWSSSENDVFFCSCMLWLGARFPVHRATEKMFWRLWKIRARDAWVSRVAVTCNRPQGCLHCHAAHWIHDETPMWGSDTGRQQLSVPLFFFVLAGGGPHGPWP